MEKTQSIEELVVFGYRTFSEYLAKERIVPSLEDGLKPVYKRVLLSAYEICARKFIKTATLSGHTLGKWHPHSIDSIDDVITNLVHMGLLEGDGAFGSRSLTGNHSPASASRYTMVRLNQDYADVLDKLLKFIPMVEGELDTKETAYLPSPVPMLCSYGSFFMGPGLSATLPAFTWQSMMDAYKANDPELLKSAYGYKIVNRECLKDIWNLGKADMALALNVKSGNLAGLRGVFIEGSPELFVPNLKVLAEWKEAGYLAITDVSSGNENKLFIGINKGVRSLTLDQLLEAVRSISVYHEPVCMLALTGGTARPCGLKAWIRHSMEAFCGLVDKYKADRISQCARKIDMYHSFDKVRDYILKHAGKNIEPGKIAQAIGVAEWIVREIDAMSVRAMRSTDPGAEIKNLEAEIKKTEKIRGKAEAEKLIKAMNREP